MKKKTHNLRFSFMLVYMVHNNHTFKLQKLSITVIKLVEKNTVFVLYIEILKYNNFIAYIIQLSCDLLSESDNKVSNLLGLTKTAHGRFAFIFRRRYGPIEVRYDL